MSIGQVILAAVCLSVAMTSRIEAAEPKPEAAEHPSPKVSPDRALQLLKEGNVRFSAGAARHPNQSAERRSDMVGHQTPFASILSCSDSRVPPEVVFDRGIGDLFVARVAGNIAGTTEIGSLEYAVEHLGTGIVVVVGHTRCGAVTAAVQDLKLEGSQPKLMDKIKPAVERAATSDPGASGDAMVEAAIEANVWLSIEDLLSSPVVRAHLKSGKLKVIGAIYDISSGKVHWLGPHPEQEQLLAGAAE